MCTDVSHSTKKATQYAKRYGDPDMWEAALEESPATYRVSGFDEPYLPVILNEDPENVDFLHWAFMPFEFAPKINGKPMNTLNARNDRIFTERSIFRQAALSRRCLVMLDGFFDHHVKDDIKYPHFVQLKTKEPFMVAGLWQTFTDPKDEVETNTLTLVTGPANKEMAWIRGEKAYSPESRMVYIVEEKDDEAWLHGDPKKAEKLIKPLPDGLLDYYPCQPLKTIKKLKREYMGNVPGLLQRKRYPELE
ncbi:MAG: SOS response-associated peptidase family protein [Cyclobacteriaceae bacterium]